MSSQYTFTGQYSFNIDSKNRINIPAPLRKQFSNKDKKMITRGGKEDDKTKFGMNKRTQVPYFIYFDIDKNNYRCATGNWKVRY